MLVSRINSRICFFKQKTAYEMRISDWSSDVCSSDLSVRARRADRRRAGAHRRRQRRGSACIREADASLRSEEHTSELQSLMRISYAVFCLKKKTSMTYNTTRFIRQQLQHPPRTPPCSHDDRHDYRTRLTIPSP